jgi:hypothetical protein
MHLSQTGFSERDPREGRSGNRPRQRDYASAKYEEFKEPDPGAHFIYHWLKKSINYSIV